MAEDANNDALHAMLHAQLNAPSGKDKPDSVQLSVVSDNPESNEQDDQEISVAAHEERVRQENAVFLLGFQHSRSFISLLIFASGFPPLLFESLTYFFAASCSVKWGFSA